jgi:6,7-dimethyl-8-ribityllumazine synthase
MGKNLSDIPDHYIAPHHQHQGKINLNHRFGIVCARFNQRITKALLTGALTAFSDQGFSPDNIHTFWVPGAFEVPVVMNQQFPAFDAMIAIACIIKGDTPHFDFVCQGITQGIVLANQAHNKPGIFCVLTTNTNQQAEDRAQPNQSNKGYEAALGAMEMASLCHQSPAKI